MNLHRNVEVWFLDKIKLSSLSHCWEDMLSLEEQQRAKRFHFHDDKNSFTIYHACKRMILSYYLRKPPREIEISLQEKGKPFLKNNSLTFNLSHTKEAAVLAVTRNTEIGVDLEKLRDFSNQLDIAKRFFHIEEYYYLKNIKNESACQEFFFLLWTAKEALLKATGEGIAFGLNNFCISAVDASFLKLRHTYPKAISLERLASSHDYMATLAIIGEHKPIIYRDIFSIF